MRISDWSSDVCSSDLDVSADFLDYVHRFAWLRDLSSVAPRAQAAPIAENLMRRWLHAHADTIADPAWHPDLCARRLQFWRSEECRVGQECVSTCRSRWSTYPYKKQTNNTTLHVGLTQLRLHHQ